MRGGTDQVLLQVISFFAAKLEKEQHEHAISSANVLDLIVQASKTWPRDRLRVGVYQLAW